MKPTDSRVSSLLRFRGRSVCLLVTACLAWLPPVGVVAHAAGDDLAAQQMSVRELMRLETSAALSQARRRARSRQHAENRQQAETDQQAGRRQSAGFDPVTPRAGARAGEPVLLAIYGVGRKLLARVRQGQSTYVYMRGHALPVGVSSARRKNVFRLQGISSGCVELRRADDSRTLCLHPALLSEG